MELFYSKKKSHPPITYIFTFYNQWTGGRNLNERRAVHRGQRAAQIAYTIVHAHFTSHYELAVQHVRARRVPLHHVQGAVHGEHGERVRRARANRRVRREPIDVRVFVRENQVAVKDERRFWREKANGNWRRNREIRPGIKP